MYPTYKTKVPACVKAFMSIVAEDFSKKSEAKPQPQQVPVMTEIDKNKVLNEKTHGK